MGRTSKRRPMNEFFDQLLASAESTLRARQTATAGYFAATDLASEASRSTNHSLMGLSSGFAAALAT